MNMIDLPVPVYADESLEDLQRSGLRLIQPKNGFRFGTDSVLLAAYAAGFYRHNRQSLAVADLGAGCGAVSLLLAARLPRSRLTGFEINPASCRVFARNIDLNRLADRVSVQPGDLRRWLTEPLPVAAEFQGYDLIVANPPYLTSEQNRSSQAPADDPAYRQSVREQTLRLHDLIVFARKWLKPKGRLVLVHRPHRLPDLFSEIRAHGLEAEKMRLVQPLPERAPVMVLLSARSQLRPGGFQLEKPLILCDRPGQPHHETASLYGSEPPCDVQQLWAGACREAGTAADAD